MQEISQLLILLIFLRLIYQHLKLSASIGELITLALFLMLFFIAGTFEELWGWMKGLV